jgi:ABC-type sugar transport system ATPase subunit
MIRVILDGLVKRFDRVAVVDGASLEIRPGELLVLVGP